MIHKIIKGLRADKDSVAGEEEVATANITLEMLERELNEQQLRLLEIPSRDIVLKRIEEFIQWIKQRWGVEVSFKPNAS